MKRFLNFLKRFLPIPKIKVTPLPTIPKHEEPSVPIIGNGELWYPKAVKSMQMKTKGRYAKGYPEGAIVHSTAGRCDSEQDAINSLEWGVHSGYTFFVIGPNGVVYQSFPLDRHGSHAGTSFWSGVGNSVSNKLVGIEVACAGKVESNGKSWFGQVFSKERLRTVGKKENQEAGTYVKFTDLQEKSLLELLTWLKENSPKVFKVDWILGHDEVSPGRKNDPGGSLSMTMPQLRQVIKDLT